MVIMQLHLRFHFFFRPADDDMKRTPIISIGPFFSCYRIADLYLVNKIVKPDLKMLLQNLKYTIKIIIHIIVLHRI